MLIESFISLNMRSLIDYYFVDFEDSLCHFWLSKIKKSQRYFTKPIMIAILKKFKSISLN